MTRLGMKEAQMEEVAKFMRRAVDGEDSAKLAAQIEEFVSLPDRKVRVQRVAAVTEALRLE